VQITGRANYQKMTTALNLVGDRDLVAHPDMALQPDIAGPIMSYGMRKGAFTGKNSAIILMNQGVITTIRAESSTPSIGRIRSKPTPRPSKLCWKTACRASKSMLAG
jgi:hypothetical protein